MGRKMARAKRRAEAISMGRSLRVLRLVSTSSTIERGKADSLSNTENGLRIAVLDHREIFFLQSSNGCAVFVRDRREND